MQKDFQPVGGKVVAYFHDAFYALWNSGLGQEFRQALIDNPSAEVWVSILEVVLIQFIFNRYSVTR
jgi:hypothetical protein